MTLTATEAAYFAQDLANNGNTQAATDILTALGSLPAHTWDNDHFRSAYTAATTALHIATADVREARHSNMIDCEVVEIIEGK